VVARSPGCFATACFEVQSAECDVRVEDGRVVITSEFVIETLDRLQCKSDCRDAEVTCASAEVAEPDIYGIEFGELEGGLVVPSRDAPVCLTGE